MRVSGGSVDGRVRDLLPGVQSRAIEGAHERRKITVATHAAEAAADLRQGGGDPAHEHPASRQRRTLRANRPTPPLRFSIAGVEHSVR
jgi:hypothetical protein